MRTKFKRVHARMVRMVCAVALGMGSSFSLATAAADSAETAPERTSIPWSQIGAKAGAEYQGEGLAVMPTGTGARLRCVFQKMEGEITRDGLWLTSRVEGSQTGRFSVMPTGVGRAGEAGASHLPHERRPLTPCEGYPFSVATASERSAAFTPLPVDSFPETLGNFPRAAAVRTSKRPEGRAPARILIGALNTYSRGEGVRRAGEGESEFMLAPTGRVEVRDKLVRFVRPGLTEEYTVSMDGVRQDFILDQRPAGAGQLRLELVVAGAKVEPLSDGARLVLENSGRRIDYSRLRVTDALGKELTARMEAASGILPDLESGRPAARSSVESFSTRGLEAIAKSTGRDATALQQAKTPAAARLVVLVNDADAEYPLRIDPTFSDANWISMGGIPGADSTVYAVVVDGSGNLYIGGDFAVVGTVFANRIARWNGSSWTALGSGMNSDVRALAVSGNDLYAGGTFTTADGSAANSIAKWNGSHWSALGSGINGTVSALAVSGSDLYAGGAFTTADGSAANSIAKWNGSHWTALGSGMNGIVFALAVSASDLYAGGAFTTAGGSAANNIAKWNGSSWAALGSGMNTDVYALAASNSDLYAGGYFKTAGGESANYIAKWNGST